MIERSFAVYPHDSVRTSFILRRTSRDGRLAVMDEYGSLVCKKCRKVDERAALLQGIQGEVVVRSKRPLLLSSDEFYLLDVRARQVFSALFPGEIEYFPIPDSAFAVASAKSWLQLGEANPGVRFAGSRCSACGRAREIVWGKEPLAVEESRRFFAINLEGIRGARETWIVCEQAAAELRNVAPTLTGLVLSPIMLNVGG